jgi:predicted TPR repeat methyltransferase
MAMKRRRNTPTSAHVARLLVRVRSRSSSTRIQQIQAEMTYRALELLSLPEGESAFLLDIGCGSGLSGEILDEQGYIWAGVDVAPSMLGASPLAKRPGGR